MIKSAQSVTVDFTTVSPVTGAATDATGTPTGTLVVNGTDNAASVTVANKATGVYKAAVTLPSLSAGDVVQLRIAATVAGVAGVGVVWTETADTKLVSELDVTAQAILEDTGTTLPSQIAGPCVGSGAISFPVTINDESSNPIDGVEVWVTTDSAGTSVVAGTLSTDAMGLATFVLDAGTYYLWRQKSGYNFTNPVAITVS